MKAMLSDEGGAVYIETLVAFIPPIIFFFVIWQTIDFFCANLIVQHAAVAATRAAVVVLPDDPRFYEGEGENRTSPTRMGDIEKAATMVLQASSKLAAGQHRVVLTNSHGEPSESPDQQSRVIDFHENEILTATVYATYECKHPWVTLVCGVTGKHTFTGTARLPYQGAPYPY